ncbi:hypothetical protein [Buttiauxella gaviniae]|uniref:hypothetical protein n=1 Tax=Buttiauxella gaviniae TaxID=82990 RepID=UPI003C786184
MSKATYVDDLVKAYEAERLANQSRTRSPYKNMHKDRWTEVCNAYNRKTIGRAKRSVGKSNKRGCRLTARGLARSIVECNSWAAICRANRAFYVKQREQVA